MFQRMCDRCGAALKDAVIELGNKNSEWKGPEMYFNIAGPEDPYDMRVGHLCKYCTEKFIDWICAGVQMDE